MVQDKIGKHLNHKIYQKLVDRVYYIIDFKWVSDENTLYNDYPYVIYDNNNRPNYADGRGQFYILNTETNNSE